MSEEKIKKKKIMKSNNKININKIAKITGNAIQDDETFKAEGGFVPERDQFYFEMKVGDDLFLVGFKDLLICLKLLENIGEIPPINYKWWLQMATLYGNDILTIKSGQNEHIKEKIE